VRGAARAFCKFLRAINDERRGNSGRVPDMARVFNLCIRSHALGPRTHGLRAMPGEAIGYVL
jgi:hypothetical protein